MDPLHFSYFNFLDNFIPCFTRDRLAGRGLERERELQKCTIENIIFVIFILCGVLLMSTTELVIQ
jgi:hypothetical protein